MPEQPDQQKHVAAPVLILGIGNILLGDEGVGVRVVERMRESDLPPGIELCDGGTSGAGLIDEIADRQKLIVIDAMQAGAVPGTVFRMCMENLLREENQLSLHEFGLSDTLAMASRLGCAPLEVVIFGVQPGEISLKLSLSPEVSAIVPDLISVVLHEARA